MSDSASTALRARTGPAHEAVDAAYGAYRLGDRESYAAFLIAHARALPAVEGWLADHQIGFAWRARRDALSADLAAMGRDMPDPLPFDLADDEAARWGALYVTEGSRLGGVMLARQVGEGLPKAYLESGFGPGEWRDFRHALDAAAEDDAWIGRAVEAAEQVFALYGKAA
ncbi:biliverdin-producing heme oxygenase [Sphingomonas sp. CFBP8993]|uniref:biliverdin-producing heme oxygenase n=1 Tax=Sphingomonas sp. CFBP8993 TaxID=3096526 RepID=UPI002A6B498E|nr:biliverdin-producing heme oxygenase [Sphingomonas sp. CFBP8993]MDY0959951.1 biliverdin-producing heme oxygenase [Sphingomonas sp. CFBP8993]